jgi:hypothetical protein
MLLSSKGMVRENGEDRLEAPVKLFAASHPDHLPVHPLHRYFGQSSTGGSLRVTLGPHIGPVDSVDVRSFWANFASLVLALGTACNVRGQVQ